MKNKNILIIFALILTSNILFSKEYSFRKYQHVKQFYKNIYADAIDVAIKYNIPPAAIMAIAGLESGYGSGYVAQITGNILSLGAFKGDNELPSLYLPYSKSKKKVLFDPSEIKQCAKNDLVWKQRPKSLKRDYRPSSNAGTTKELELLKHNEKLKEQAFKACLNDFATRWIIKDSKVKVFKDAKNWIENKVTLSGKKILFDEDTNKKFISMIGGHPHSFNYRETWPKKAKLIMSKAGLVKLANDIFINKKNFNDAWSNK